MAAERVRREVGVSRRLERVAATLKGHGYGHWRGEGWAETGDGERGGGDGRVKTAARQSS